jgi:ribonuclease P protein component
MLPRRARLRRTAEFTSVMRQGYRVAQPALVLYAVAAPTARFGVIVGKRVGDAVTRNRVKRQLRHRARALLAQAGMDVVVRALPGAAGADLAGQLGRAWGQAVRVVRP